jgi:hypothetical protein
VLVEAASSAGIVLATKKGCGVIPETASDAVASRATGIRASRTRFIELFTSMGVGRI